MHLAISRQLLSLAKYRAKLSGCMLLGQSSTTATSSSESCTIRAKMKVFFIFALPLIVSSPFSPLPSIHYTNPLLSSSTLSPSPLLILSLFHSSPAIPLPPPNRCTAPFAHTNDPRVFLATSQALGKEGGILPTKRGGGTTVNLKIQFWPPFEPTHRVSQ
eukprot:608157-Hanusia_phi.AAC.3